MSAAIGRIRKSDQSPEEYIALHVRHEDRGYSTPCWIWQGCLNERGYAQAILPQLGRMRIHRATYQLHVGPIPDGLVIDHLCCVKSCCNPDHLEPVTDEENRRRAGQTFGNGMCKRGLHLLALTRGYDGGCRVCTNALRAAARKRKKERALELVT